jgi:hypothetical protein
MDETVTAARDLLHTWLNERRAGVDEFEVIFLPSNSGTPLGYMAVVTVRLVSVVDESPVVQYEMAAA